MRAEAVERDMKRYITFEQWQSWCEQGYSMLPYVERIALEGPIRSWEPVWETAGPHAALFESGKEGRYHIIGMNPVSVIQGKGKRAEIRAILAGDEAMSDVQVRYGSPIQLVQQWMSPYRSPYVEGLPKCIGGCAGYWSYDVVRHLERLPEKAADELPIPEYLFMRFEELWVVDLQERAVWLCVHREVPVPAPTSVPNSDKLSLKECFEQAEHAAARMRDLWRSWMHEPPAKADQREAAFRSYMASEGIQIDIDALQGLKRSFTGDEYQAAVRRIQDYIAAGDVFQVNLAVRQSRPTKAAPELVYEWLRLINPSPYMGLIRWQGGALVSGSPELLVLHERGRLATRPIAGTRKRGATPEQDARLEAELTGSEKERAEHVMLVDLLRNDIGRVSAYGTVRVEELMTVERYSHVMHLVSEVTGRIAAGKDGYDVLAAVFPGGTITGAPKIRTMEIIEELEPVRRGPYTGSMGWIDYNGNMEFNITIRTLVMAEGTAHVQAGAGIVIDSDPEREYAESLNKAKALWKALLYGEREQRSGDESVRGEGGDEL